MGLMLLQMKKLVPDATASKPPSQAWAEGLTPGCAMTDHFPEEGRYCLLPAGEMPTGEQASLAVPGASLSGHAHLHWDVSNLTVDTTQQGECLSGHTQRGRTRVLTSCGAKADPKEHTLCAVFMCSVSS